jgi:hypothetical protein
MKFSVFALSGAIVATWSIAASGQQVASGEAAPSAPTATASTAVIVAPTTSNILRAGTKVPLKMAEGLSTQGKKLLVGQRFQMEVAEAVMLDSHIVIPAGSPAVTDVRNKGMWGKSGRINARALYVRVNGRQIRLTGQLDDKGVTGTAGVVAAIAFIPVAGFFTTGTSAKIPLGAPVVAFLDEDLTIAFAQAPAPEPIVVPVAALATVETAPAAPTASAGSDGKPNE